VSEACRLTRGRGQSTVDPSPGASRQRQATRQTTALGSVGCRDRRGTWPALAYSDIDVM